MADSPSGFRSWQDELNLNGEQEQRLLDNALAEASKTRGQAGNELTAAQNEAGAAQTREARSAGGVATTTLSMTGSYGDYQRLLGQANEQYQAAVQGQSGVAGMIRRSRAQSSGVAAEWVQHGDELEARQQRMEAESAAGATSTTKYVADEKARAEKAALDAKNRGEDDAQNRNNFNASLINKMKGQWAQIDKQNGSFGFDPKNSFTVAGDVNPFGATASSSPWAGDPKGDLTGDPDAARLAQMARSQGLNDEADKYQSTGTYVMGKRTKGGF